MKNRTMCSDCGTRPVSAQQRGNGGSLCQICEDYAGWENTHSDYGHDAILAEVEDKSGDPATYLSDTDLVEYQDTMPNCPVCQNDNSHLVKRTGHTNTATRSHNSHAGCKHQRTPKDRAACRKAGGPQAAPQD